MCDLGAAIDGGQVDGGLLVLVLVARFGTRLDEDAHALDVALCGGDVDGKIVVLIVEDKKFPTAKILQKSLQKSFFHPVNALSIKEDMKA